MASTMLTPLNREVFLPMECAQAHNDRLRFISTMETETIASRNVVDLLLTETFGTGICGSASPVEGEQQAQESPDFVLGWDC